MSEEAVIFIVLCLMLTVHVYLVATGVFHEPPLPEPEPEHRIFRREETAQEKHVWSWNEPDNGW